MREIAEQKDFFPDYFTGLVCTNYINTQVHFIAFLNYEQFNGTCNWIHRLALTEQDTKSPYVYDNYLQIYVELPKFAKKIDSCSPFLDKLIFSMKQMGTCDTTPEVIQEEDIIRFYDAARFNTFSTDEQAEYLEEMLTKEEYQDAMDYAIEKAEKRGLEKGLEEGMEKGIEKGMEKGRLAGKKEGIKEGIEQGIEQGRQEGIEKATFQIASRMKELGKSEEDIMQITGLAPDQVRKL